MEPNLPVITKKFWNVVRTMLYLLRKGISKGKLMGELNMLFKRWKIAGKALQNLLFHHAHHWSSASSSSSSTTGRRSSALDSPKESDQISCTNSPAHPNLHQSFNLNKRKHKHLCALFSPSPAAEEEEEETMNAVVKTLEVFYSAKASPANFGKRPMVRQLRVTDSPFPLRDADEDHHVDEAAEQFIMKFYNDLKRQLEIATTRRAGS